MTSGSFDYCKCNNGYKGQICETHALDRSDLCDCGVQWLTSSSYSNTNLYDSLLTRYSIKLIHYLTLM